MFSRKLLLTILLLAGNLHAEEQVRAVQEELRRRNMYFGDIDGQRTPELEKATRSYQKRKGFSENGSEDPDTLRSLGLLPRSPNEAPPKELEWPQEPILKSDAKIDVLAEAQRIGEEAGVAPESIAPDAMAAAEPPASKATKRKMATPVSPRVIKTFAPVSPAVNERRSTRASSKDQRLEPVELARFLADYMKAVSRNDVRRELEFYADRVSYYANGEVDRRIIESSLKRYYERWPSRKYDVDWFMKVNRIASRGEIVITVRVNFTLKNKGKVVRGQTDNTITINAGTSDPRIVAIEEHRVRL